MKGMYALSCHKAPPHCWAGVCIASAEATMGTRINHSIPVLDIGIAVATCPDMSPQKA